MSATQQGTQDEDQRIIAFKGDALTLTDAEVERLAELEAQIERSNADRGRALREINKGRLYRATHPNFEAYLKVRWDMSRSRAYQLMDFADELDLSTNVDKPKTEGAHRANKAAQKKLEKVTTLKAENKAIINAPSIYPVDAELSSHPTDRISLHEAIANLRVNEPLIIKMTHSQLWKGINLPVQRIKIYGKSGDPRFIEWAENCFLKLEAREAILEPPADDQTTYKPDPGSGPVEPDPAYKNQIVARHEDRPAFVRRQMKKEEKLLKKQDEAGEYNWLIVHQTEYTHLVERAQYYLNITEQKQFDRFIKKNPVLSSSAKEAS